MRSRRQLRKFSPRRNQSFRSPLNNRKKKTRSQKRKKKNILRRKAGKMRRKPLQVSRPTAPQDKHPMPGGFRDAARIAPASSGITSPHHSLPSIQAFVVSNRKKVQSLSQDPRVAPLRRMRHGAQRHRASTRKPIPNFRPLTPDI